MTLRAIKKQVHGSPQVLRIDAAPGWRAILEDEVREVLATPLQDYKFQPEIKPAEDWIEIHGIDFRQVLELPLRLRCAADIYWRIADRHVGSFGEYESHLRATPWELFLSPGVGLRLRIQSFLSALFRRGYKVELSHAAPLQEHLAASAIRWALDGQSYDCLYIPFAGSGTLLFEAWLQQAKLMLPREFPGLDQLPEFPRGTWQHIQRRMKEIALEPVRARVVERDAGSFEGLKANVKGFETFFPTTANRVDTVQSDIFLDTVPSEPKSFFIPLNPPYGLRLDEDTQNLYAKLGDWLAQRFADDQKRFGFVLVADSKAYFAFEKAIGAKHIRGIQSFMQGGQHIRCVRFTLGPQGSKA